MIREISDAEALFAGFAVLEALEDDLNTPVAKARTFEIVRALNSATDPDEKRRLKSELLAACRLLGIGRSDPEDWLKRRPEPHFVDPKPGILGLGGQPVTVDEIDRLVAARNQARRDKDFATADRIRDQLAEQGVVLEDGPEGTKWRKVG